MEKSSGSSVKWIIIVIASVLFLAFFSYLIISTKQSKSNKAASSVSLSSDGQVRGSASASATLVEFGDFQCQACKAYEPFVSSALADFDGKIKLIFKHFPLTTIHRNAMAAAIAAEAAGLQGKFWEMHDILYDKQSDWVDLNALGAQVKFISFAKNLELDVEKFTKDLEDKSLSEKVSKMQQEGISAGVSGTPTFFINGKLIQNPANYNDFKSIIEISLK